MIRSLLVFLVLIASIAPSQGQSMFPALRMPETVLSGPVLLSSDGKVICGLLNGPKAPNGTRLFSYDLKELLSDTIPHETAGVFAPYVGYDFNANGLADFVQRFGSWDTIAVMDGFSGGSEILRLSMMGVMNANGGARSNAVWDVDGDGIDDYVANFGSYLQISYGDSVAPFSDRSYVPVWDGLTEEPRDVALQFGIMANNFTLLKYVFEDIPGETFEYLQLDVMNTDDLAERRDTIRRAFTQAKVDGFDLGETVALQSGDHWHLWREEDNMTLHSSLEGIEFIEADPTFRQMDGSTFTAEALFGRARTADNAVGVIDMSRQMYVVRLAVQDEPGLEDGDVQPYVDELSVVDPASLRTTRIRSYSLQRGSKDMLATVQLQAIPDISGDSEADLVIGYQSGEVIVIDYTDVFVSDGAISSVIHVVDQTSLIVIRTADGWIVRGLSNVDVNSAAAIYDIRGVVIGTAQVSNNSELNIILPLAPRHAPLWALVGGLVVRLQ